MAEDKLGRFGHHPDPAIDFEVEVQSLEARLLDLRAGSASETISSVHRAIEEAMTFRVGGDPSAVRANDLLRTLEKTAKELLQEKTPVSTPSPEDGLSANAKRLLARVRAGRWYAFDDPRTPDAMDELMNAGLVQTMARCRELVSCWVPVSTRGRASDEALVKFCELMREHPEARIVTDVGRSAFSGWGELKGVAWHEDECTIELEFD